LTPDKKQLVKAWIAALLWIGLIAIESTDTFSAEHTSKFLYPLLHFLMGLDLERFAVVHHYIRKCGHFVGYFTLSFFLFRAWRATLRLPWAHVGSGRESGRMASDFHSFADRSNQ
jgi:VanZ family protein